MASGTLGGGSRKSKVYSRKSQTKPPNPNSHQTLADHRSSPSPPPRHRRPPPSDEASGLGYKQRFVTISLDPSTSRELRRKLAGELEQVRALAGRIEALEVQLATYSHSQLSASGPRTPNPSRRQLSLEKEKRTPKASQQYRNSEFVLGKEKQLLSPDRKKPKKLPFLDVNRETQMAGAFKSCEALLAKLVKHKHGWVFKTPVDVMGLGLHDYHTIIKTPMDLGTVKSRLAKNWYKSPGEFAEDVRLTFGNAMTYNPKGHDVHVMAEQLSQMFEERWPAIEAEYTYRSHPPPAKKTTMLDTRAVERSDSTMHHVAEDVSTNRGDHTAHVGRMPGLKKPKAKDPHKRDMTFEEKQRLSNYLQNMPTEKLDSVVQIIKKRNSTLSQNDDEIEVDIDVVDAETLWELDRFVTNYKKSLSKNKRKAEVAAQSRAEDKPNGQESLAERIEPVASKIAKESSTDDKEVLSAVAPVGSEKEGDNGNKSSSSSSSSSDSGSSSSDSGSRSSSACGSEAAHSPRT